MPTKDGPPKEAITLERFAPLHLISDTPKGRGVFAGRSIPSGTIIDTCPILILPPQENTTHISHTTLYHYTYNWPLPSSSSSSEQKKKQKTQAVVFGLGSMFNHSTQDQNVGWQRDLVNELIVYRALRDIGKGEELCISYGDHLTFVDADAPRQPTEEDLGREAEELLGRISLDQ